MLRLLLMVYFVLTCSADELFEERKHSISNIKENNIFSQEMEESTEVMNIEYVLKKIEIIAEKSIKEGTVPMEQIEENYDEMVKTIQELIDLLKVPQYAYTFLNIKGLDRFIISTSGIDYEPLKKQFLILIKTLFNIIPIKTISLFPISIIDKLLDIFEHDDNLALKTYALDIMYVWLPNNPKVQARVMKLKGLEPFYNQVSKLDKTVVYTLLDLFNKILEEHVIALDDTLLKKKDDMRELYEKIGLVERMSTPTVCNGLLNIFEVILSFNDNKQFPRIVFNLVSNIKPFCLKIYKRKTQTIKVFEALKSYITDNIDVFKTSGFNMSEMKMLLEDFTMKINKNEREEF